MAHQFYFFAGGDYKPGHGNAFTANFIRYLGLIMEHRFSVINGIYHPWPLVNVIWALNRAQEPEKKPHRNAIISRSVNQILSDPRSRKAEVTLLSSSYGSVVAAQTACCLAGLQLSENKLKLPFNVALGASIVNTESALYKNLLHYRDKGAIKTILYDDLQDEGDNSKGVGGRTSLEAYANGLGICFPMLSPVHSGPSFLSTHPVKGHLHRVRSHSIQKARDFVQTILIDHRMGGEEAMERAERLLEEEGNELGG